MSQKEVDLQIKQSPLIDLDLQTNRSKEIAKSQIKINVMKHVHIKLHSPEKSHLQVLQRSEH